MLPQNIQAEPFAYIYEVGNRQIIGALEGLIDVYSTHVSPTSKPQSGTDHTPGSPKAYEQLRSLTTLQSVHLPRHVHAS